MLNPNEIASKTFDKGMAGYKVDEVESFLQLVSQEMQALIDEKEVLEKKIVVLADKIEEYREDEDSLKAALVGAQKLGETVIREAKEKADKIQREAAKKAEFTISDAKSAVQREQKALDNIQAEVASFKDKLIETYRQHVELINDLADFGPKPKKQVEQKEKEAPVSQHADMQNEICETIPQQPRQALQDEENVVSSKEEFELHMNIDENSEIGESSFSFGIAQEDEIEIEAEPTMSFRPPINDSRFGPLKFGDEYDVVREDIVEQPEPKVKSLFSKRKR